MTRTSTSRTRGRTGALATMGALATVLTLASCGSQVAGSGAGTGSLPVLRIGTGSATAADAAGAPGVAGSGAIRSGQGTYTLEGTLPSGPSSARVLRYDDAQVPAADVASLAASLGVTGTPARHAHGWEVLSSTGDVRVHDGGTVWSYSRGADQCPSYAVDIDTSGDAASTSSCGIAVSPPGPVSGTDAGSTGTGGATTSPPAVTGTAPSAAAALAAAKPVLAAAGLGDAEPRVLAGSAGYPLRTVVVDPVVDGLPTSGVRTLVDVDSDGVAGATGVLATAKPGDTYPIISAAAALDLLRAMPQPEIAIACVQGKACPGVGPRTVTGAVLGLTTAYDSGAPILVPAWLFTIKGEDDPVPVVAVERAYLGDPSTDPNAGETSPGSTGGGSGSVPGSSGAPDTPVPVTEPPAGGTTSTPGSAPVQSASVSADGRTLTLDTVGGVCETYTGSVAETSTEVRVTITVTSAQKPGMACPAMAKDITVRVGLAAPLGSRTLLDGASGQRVPIT